MEQFLHHYQQPFRNTTRVYTNSPVPGRTRADAAQTRWAALALVQRPGLLCYPALSGARSLVLLEDQTDTETATATAAVGVDELLDVV